MSDAKRLSEERIEEIGNWGESFGGPTAREMIGEMMRNWRDTFLSAALKNIRLTSQSSFRRINWFIVWYLIEMERAKSLNLTRNQLLMIVVIGRLVIASA